MYQIQQSTTAYPLVFLMVSSTDHITGATGLTPTVTLSKNGGTFGTAAGAVSEIANGVYKVAGNATDTNTLGPLTLNASATGQAADPATVFYDVIAYNPQDAVRLGLTALPNANAASANGLPTSGAGANQITLSSGAVNIAAGQLYVKKNTGLNNFEFLMTDSTTNAPKTGLTVTSQVSIDGGAFGATVNTASEIANGVYKLNLAAADLNGTIITLLFTAAAANNTYRGLITQA